MRLVAQELFHRSGQGYALAGSRCLDCGEIFFPAPTGCTRCCSTSFEPFTLGDRGVLWSWTVQSFLPKAPYDSGEDEQSFAPYGVGYVEMPCGVKVESRIVAGDLKQLAIGMPMRLVLEPYRRGNDIRTYAFEPLP